MNSDIEPYFNGIHNESDFQKSDWWETAFKPKFSIKECKEILDLSYDSTSESLTLPSDEINHFKNVKEVSDDIDNDKNIYRKIWREQRFALNDFAKLKSCLSESYINNLVKIEEGLDKSTQTKECIWEAKELKILRSCIVDFKRKDVKLSAQVNELKNQNEELSVTIKHLEKSLVKKKSTLSEAVKANERFHILSETISSQLEEAKSRHGFVIKQKDSLVEQLSRTNVLVEQLKEQNLEKESEINNLRKILSRTDEKNTIKMENLKSNIEKKHNIELNSLQTELQQLKMELFKEKEQHSATNKGFQQLLKHFSNKSTAFSHESKTIDINSIKFTNK